MALQCPPLSRVFGMRLLRILGRELPRQRQQAESAEVLRSVCGGCGQYMLPPYNSEITFDEGDVSDKRTNETIDLSKRISTENLASTYSITCNHCSTKTIVPIQLLRPKSSTSVKVEQESVPSKPTSKVVSNKKPALKAPSKPSPKSKKQSRAKPQQQQQGKRKKPEPKEETTSFKDFLKGM